MGPNPTTWRESSSQAKIITANSSGSKPDYFFRKEANRSLEHNNKIKRDRKDFFTEKPSGGILQM